MTWRAFLTRDNGTEVWRGRDFPSEQAARDAAEQVLSGAPVARSRYQIEVEEERDGKP